MPTWKCLFFARKPSETFHWNQNLENCGLCVNWCDGSCLHQEKLKDIGENDLGKTHIYDDNINVVYNSSNDGGSDGN